MKQRRLYKVDSRFAHTGKELLNVRGGGDLGSNPGSSIPLINTKAARKLDWQNKKKLQEGIDVAFGKEKKKLQQKINIKKLGKKASRSIQGGRAKVRAIKARAALAQQKKGSERKSK